MLIRFLYAAILSTALALSLAPISASAQEQSAEQPSLYERLGGYDVIAATVDNFLERFDADPVLVPFLGGVNAAEGARIRQHFVDFICARTGGPCLYLGRDMTETHEGLSIMDAQFESVIEHLTNALDHQGVEDPEKRELLSFLVALRAQIVTN
jgi:hemoglobin